MFPPNAHKRPSRILLTKVAEAPEAEGVGGSGGKKAAASSGGLAFHTFTVLFVADLFRWLLARKWARKERKRRKKQRELYTIARFCMC